MKAMILTAGLGTRLRPVTEKFAKPAVPFLNIPLLYYPLFLMEEAGAKAFVLNTHHLPEQIAALSKNIPGLNAKIELSHEPGAPLGSGGGIWKARSYLEGGGDFLVANGDEVILPKEKGLLKSFVETHHREKNLATILVMEHPLVGTQFGGVWTDTNGNVRGFGKDKTKFGPDVRGYHYIGLLLLNDRIFSYLPEGESNILYDALQAAIANGERVRTVVGSFTWFETGNPKDFLEATAEGLHLLADGDGVDADYLRQTTQRFWTSGTRLDARSGGFILSSPSSDLSPGASVRGFVVLGDNTRVEAGATIDRSVLLTGAALSAAGNAKNAILLPD